MIHDQLVRTAVHEASHAVVGAALGRRVVVVHIRPVGDGRGACMLDPREGPPPLAAIVAGEIGVDLVEAGAPAPARPRTVPWLFDRLAEQKLTPDPAIVFGGPSDREMVAEARPTAADVERAQTYARKVLLANWWEVHGLAAELLAQGSVKDPQVNLQRAAGREVVSQPHGGLPVAAAALEVLSHRERRRDVDGKVREVDVVDAYVYR